MVQIVAGAPVRNPLWVFEESFRLLRSVVPTPREGEPLTLVSRNGEQTLRVRLLESGRYTDTLMLTRSFAADHSLLPDLAMKVRTYYDARLVEVIAYQDCHRIPPRYQVVEGGRFTPDEKRQVNLLLHELLRNCRACGYRVIEDSDYTEAGGA